MAEKKEHKFVKANSDEKVTTEPKLKQAKPAGDASGKRVAAVILWVLAIVSEVLGLLVLNGKNILSFLPTMTQLIVFIVLDLIFIVIGSTLWKKANHIDPASESNKVKFWLWNNLGLIVTCIAFIPFAILLLTNKKLDKKTKTIATVAAIIALLIGGATSVDYNPVSEEMKEAAVQELTGITVYWSPFGKVYHTHSDCGYLNQTDTLTYGDVSEAIANNRTKLCSHCAKLDGITSVATDE